MFIMCQEKQEAIEEIKIQTLFLLQERGHAK